MVWGYKYMKQIYIEHDNGIKDQYGFSVEEIFSESEIKTLIKSYEGCGITVYGWGVLLIIKRLFEGRK